MRGVQRHAGGEELSRSSNDVMSTRYLEVIDLRWSGRFDERRVIKRKVKAKIQANEYS